MNVLISKMPRRRSERIRRMNEARAYSPGFRNVRGPPRRRRVRVERRRERRERINRTEMTAIQNLFAWFLNTRPNNSDNNFLNFRSYISNDNVDEVESPADLILRVFEFLVNVALYECPSLAELFQANPREGIRKFIRIIRYFFF